MKNKHDKTKQGNKTSNTKKTKHEKQRVNQSVKQLLKQKQHDHEKQQA